MTIISILAEPGTGARSASTTGTAASVVLGACLFALLVFSTVTVFVQAAWALQSFQIGVYALLAVYLLAGIGREKEEVASGFFTVPDHVFASTSRNILIQNSLIQRTNHRDIDISRRGKDAFGLEAQNRAPTLPHHDGDLKFPPRSALDS